MAKLETKAYFHALGEFVQAYALCEYNMQPVLMHYSGMQYGVAQAVFGGVRISEAIDCIRRIQAAKQEPVDAQLERAFQHLHLLTGVRNFIIHKGTMFDDKGDGIVSNWGWSHTPEAHKEIRVNVKTLQDMKDDLLTVNSTLMFHGSFRRDKQASPYEEDGRAAWLYKPPQPVPAKRTTPSGARTPRLQQKASRKLLRPKE